jgi:hypothetical protein
VDVPTGAVVIAGLHYAGKPTAEVITGLIGKLLTPMADAAGQGIAASLQAWAKKRGELAGKTVIEAANLLHNAAIEPQPVPGRILMPILEASSLEEDEQLRSRWSALLANAASTGPSNKIIPAFAEILRQLMPIHAEILDWMFSLKTQAIVTSWPDVARSDIEHRFHLSPEDYALLIMDMERLQLIEPRRDINTMEREPAIDVGQLVHLVVDRWNSRVKYDSVSLTTLGIRFMQACTPPAGTST